MAVLPRRDALTGTAYGVAAIVILLGIGYANGQKAMPQLASVTAPVSLTVNDPVRRMAQDWNTVTKLEDGLRLPVITDKGLRAFDIYHRPPNTTPLLAGETAKPTVAFMVLGLGFDRNASQLALASLPAETGIGLSPSAPYRTDILSTIRNEGRELWVHAPSTSLNPSVDEGDQAMRINVPATLNTARLQQALGSLSHYVGVVLSPDSEVSSSMEDMEPVISELGQRGLGFARLAASPSLMLNMNAVKDHVPFIPSATLLSDVPLAGSVQQRLNTMLQIARDSGYALGVIDEPNPVVIKEIGNWLAEHQNRDVTLVPPSALTTATPAPAPVATLGEPPAL